MRLEAIDLNALPALAALLEERHVTRAAQRIGVTQSAMSALLARLRTRFDDPLLVRVNGRFELTPLARSIAPLTRDALDANLRVFSSDDGFDPGTAVRTFKMCLSDYAQSRIGPAAVELLAREAPGCSIQFLSLDMVLLSRDVDATLLRSDLLVAPTVALGRYARCATTLFTDELVVVLPASAELNGGVEQALRSLPGVTACLGAGDGMVVSMAEGLLAESGLEWAAATTSFLALPHLIARGRSWALMPRRLAVETCRPDLFRILAWPFGAAKFTEAAASHSSRRRDRGIEWLTSRLAADWLDAPDPLSGWPALSTAPSL